MFLSKLILPIWLLALNCLTTVALPTGFAEIPVCAVHCLQSVSSFSFDYDRRIQAHINYDGSSKGIFDYDGAGVRIADECARQSVSSRTPFAKFAQFLAAETGGNVGKTADKVLEWLGPDSKISKPPGGSDLVLRSADGTKQIRFDLTNPHGLDPHVNVETFEPRNLFPGDRKMIQTGNDHVFLKP